MYTAKQVFLSCRNYGREVFHNRMQEVIFQATRGPVGDSFTTTQSKKKRKVYNNVRMECFVSPSRPYCKRTASGIACCVDLLM